MGRAEERKTKAEQRTESAVVWSRSDAGSGHRGTCPCAAVSSPRGRLPFLAAAKVRSVQARHCRRLSKERDGGCYPFAHGVEARPWSPGDLLQEDCGDHVVTAALDQGQE
eukprot:2370601-Rhodomonas_salina.2